MKRKRDHTEEWLADFEPHIVKGSEEIVTEELVARFQIEHLERESKDEQIASMGMSTRTDAFHKLSRRPELPDHYFPTLYVYYCQCGRYNVSTKGNIYHCQHCYRSNNGTAEQYVRVNAEAYRHDREAAAFDAGYSKATSDLRSLHTEDLRNGPSETTSDIQSAMPTETDTPITKRERQYKRGYSDGYEHGQADAYNSSRNRERTRGFHSPSGSLDYPW